MGFSSIIFIVLIGLGIWWFMKKKKQKNSVNELISNRRNKDEVWKTIKQYLKDNGEYGKEIIDSYVVKRNHKDYINPNWTKLEKKNKKAEIKIRKDLEKQRIIKAKSNKKHYKKADLKDLYVVAFTTKDTKTNNVDSPRVIECEVVNKKINKKEWDRKIVINGLLNYDTEMEWIAPVKAAEFEKNQKIDEKNAKIAAKNQEKIQKKLEKEKQKAVKNATKIKH